MATENDRMGWDRLFRHPIFKGRFDKNTDGVKHMEDKFKKVMADIRFVVNSQNIHLRNLWEENGYLPEEKLN